MLSDSFKNIKIALVSDSLRVHGGAEMHLKAIWEMFPDATIYSAVIDEGYIRSFFPGAKIQTSFINKLPFQDRLQKEYLLLYPFAYKSFNLSQFDLVISVSSAFAKFVEVKQPTKHIFVCLTPPRFLWGGNRSTVHSNRISYKIYKSIFENPLHNYWRKLDYKAAHKADIIVPNSREVANRVKKYYERDSFVVYPPVETSHIKPRKVWSNKNKVFLYLGRVEVYKGVELAIRACHATNNRLLIAGKGSDLERMKDLVKSLKAEPLIDFLGFVSEEKKIDLMQTCTALIYPVKDEDFGIVPVEANAAGTPVLAYRGGGVVESLSEDPRTCIFFENYTWQALASVLKEFDSYEFNPDNCVQQARRFSKEVFQNNMRDLIQNVLQSK